jgi:hypothetical protein
MYLNSLTFSSPKRFYNQDFHVLLNFSRSGLVDGTISHQFMGMDIKKDFTGLYEIEDPKIKIGFIAEWHYPEQCCQVLTAFSAELFHYSENKECLLIRWLQITENTIPPMERDTPGISLLFSSENESTDPLVRNMIAQPSSVFG